MMYDPDKAKIVTKMGQISLREIMVYLDTNFTVGSHGQLIPRNPPPDVVIIDHLSKLK